MLKQFEAMIQDRESRLLDFIKAPRSMEEIVGHRFVYRPGQTGFIIDETERRSMAMHLDRLIEQGHVNFIEDAYQVKSL